MKWEQFSIVIGNINETALLLLWYLSISPRFNVNESCCTSCWKLKSTKYWVYYWIQHGIYFPELKETTDSGSNFANIVLVLTDDTGWNPVLILMSSCSIRVLYSHRWCSVSCNSVDKKGALIILNNYWYWINWWALPLVWHLLHTSFLQCRTGNYAVSTYSTQADSLLWKFTGVSQNRDSWVSGIQIGCLLSILTRLRSSSSLKGLFGSF